MIKEIKEVYDKYDRIDKTSEYVNIKEVLCDLYNLMNECRLKRIPKKDR